MAIKLLCGLRCRPEKLHSSSSVQEKCGQVDLNPHRPLHRVGTHRATRPHGHCRMFVSSHDRFVTYRFITAYFITIVSSHDRFVTCSFRHMLVSSHGRFVTYQFMTAYFITIVSSHDRFVTCSFRYILVSSHGRFVT